MNGPVAEAPSLTCGAGAASSRWGIKTSLRHESCMGLCGIRGFRQRFDSACDDLDLESGAMAAADQ